MSFATFEVDMTHFPKNFMELYNGFTPTEKKRWKEDRYRALTDELYFASEVLDMDFQENPHKYLFKNFLKKNPGTPLYDLDIHKKKRMILWTRGVFKTSGVVVDIAHTIVNYPNVRILFLAGGLPLAKMQLARVKKFFERPTKKFQNLFPEFCGKKLGNMTSFSVPCQSASRSYAEPTMFLTTAKSVTSGFHADLIYVDDLVHTQNYKSIKALDKCMQEYRDIQPMLAPSGFLIVTGTRYSFGDAYEQIQTLAKEEMEKRGSNPWLFSIQSCWTKLCECGHSDIEHDFDSNLVGVCAHSCGCMGFKDSGSQGLLFPPFRKKDGEMEGLSREKLESVRIELGPDFFSCQYECNPLSSEEQTFTPDLIAKQTFWHQEQFPTAQQAPCFFMCDWSYVGADDRDVSVNMCVRYYKGKLYVVDCIAGKWDASTVVEQLFGFADKHRPTMIWIEGFPARDSYNLNIENYAKDHRLMKLPVMWKTLTQGKGAKLIRIGAIKGALAQERISIYGHMPNYETLVNQLIKWPKLGKHDDYADCLGLACEVPTGMTYDYVPREMGSSLSFIRSLHEEPDEVYDTRIPGSYMTTY